MKVKIHSINFVISLIVLPAMICASCIISPPEEHVAKQKCAQNEDCPKGKICVGGKCVKEGDPDKDLPDTGDDDEDSGKGCLTDMECGDKRICEEGVCINAPHCVNDSDCKGDRVCENNSCVTPSGGDGDDINEDCPAGQEICIGLEVHICQKDGSTKYITTCDSEKQVCYKGSCVFKACEPSQWSCEKRGEVSIMCNRHGTMYESRHPCSLDEFCDAQTGRCAPQVCRPGERNCKENTVQICNNRGSAFDDVLNCGSTLDCVKGHCLSRNCFEGEFKCLGDEIWVCKEDLSGFTVGIKCNENEYCEEDECLPQKCEPYSRKCDGNKLIQCDMSGKEQSLLDICSPPEPKCEPKSASCVECLSDADCGALICNKVSFTCLDPCRGKECGTFSGRKCGDCPSDKTCNTVLGVCQKTCIPECEDICGGGEDGCGGFCTKACPSGKVCQNKKCVACGERDLPCCEGNNCSTGLECSSNVCVKQCVPQCADKCGGASDGCGGTCTASCGTGKVCVSQACVACGASGQPCCASNQCNSGLSCQSGTCQTTNTDEWYDPSSGLTWKRDPSPDKLTWQQAIDYCQALGGGWRSPTISELRTLIRGCPATVIGGSCGVTDDCLRETICQDASCKQNGCEIGNGPTNGCYYLNEIEGICDVYWSSSAGGDYTYNGWRIRFYNATVDAQAKSEKGGYARCVRSACIPNCTDKCGGASDGCGGTCTATCPSGKVCVSQACVACGASGQPCCASNQCNSGLSCQSGTCQGTCTPNCAGKECGDDGCGGSCGTCTGGKSCDGGICKADQCTILFQDDFEDGTLNKWTIGGRQQGINSATVVTRNGSKKAHLHHEEYTEITIEKTFDYQDNLRFQFEIEGEPVTSFGDTSSFLCSSDVSFYFLDNESLEVGRVHYGWRTSSYGISTLPPERKWNYLTTKPTNLDLIAEEILSQITQTGSVNKINLRFQAYCTGWPQVEKADTWVDDVVVSQCETTAKLPPINGNLILGVETGATINLAAVHSDNTDYQGTYYEGDWLCWDRQASSLPGIKITSPTFRGDDYPSDVVLKFCAAQTGEFYVGVTAGTVSSALSMIQSNYIMGRFSPSDLVNSDIEDTACMEANFKQSVLGIALWQYFMKLDNSLVKKGYAINGPETESSLYYDRLYRMYNGYQKPIFVVDVILYSGDGHNNLQRFKKCSDKWCPQSNYDTMGSGKRTFDIEYTNASNSYAAITAWQDNSNTSYIKGDGVTKSSGNKCCTDFKGYIDFMPQSVELGYNISWSDAKPSFSVAVLGDSVTVSNWNEWNASNVQNPSNSLDQNPAPWVFEIPKGWSSISP